MPDTSREPDRVLGVPRGQNRYARQGEEPQRVLGVPIDSIGPIDPEFKLMFTHPVRAYRRWQRRRRLGPYALDDDGPAKE